jgi:SAM-dependent methyltransferase
MGMCVACGGSAGWEPLWQRLLKCPLCGHCIADLDLEKLDPAQIYSPAYFAGDEYADYLADRGSMEKHFRTRLREILRYRTSGRLIEIGCAYGFFLNLARRHFDVIGYDISPAAVRHAVSEFAVDARCEDLVHTHLEPESADLVVMWDVIEHLPRPDLTVFEAGKALRPGGYLFATTGDIGSLLARLRKAKWRLIHPPSHLHYFNQISIGRLLSRADLSVLKVRHVGVRRSVRQTAYSLCMLGSGKFPGLYKAISSSPFADLSFALNTFDIMLVVAQKLTPQSDPR